MLLKCKQEGWTCTSILLWGGSVCLARCPHLPSVAVRRLSQDFFQHAGGIHTGEPLLEAVTVVDQILVIHP